MAQSDSTLGNKQLLMKKLIIWKWECEKKVKEVSQLTRNAESLQKPQVPKIIDINLKISDFGTYYLGPLFL